MKKNKMTKLALALGTVATIAAPIAAVVSCGSTSDTAKQVIIKTTWAASGNQLKALNSVVDAYNAQKDTGDYKVVVQHVEGGYGKAFDNDVKDIKIGHMAPVADAYIDYPDTIGRLTNVKNKDYSLDLATLPGGEKIRGDFDPAFVKFNDEIKGATAGKSLFAAPLASSTDMMTIDLPLLGKFLSEGFTTPVTADKADGIVDKALKAWKSSGDKDEINKLWGAAKTKAPTTLVVNDATFNSYDEIFAFSSAMQKAFGKTVKSADPHVIGADAPTNTLYDMVYSQTDAEMSKFIFSKDANTFLKSADSEAAKTFKTAATKIADAVKSGGLVLNGGGAYSSKDLVAHRMAIAIGSTAGFSHNYSSVGDMKLTFGTDANPVNIKFGSYDKELTTNGLTGDVLLKTNDKYGNPVKIDTTDHYAISVAAADKTKLTALTKDSANHIWYIDKKELVGIKATDAFVVPAKNIDSKGAAHEGYIIASKKGTFSKNDPKQLNFNEAAFVPAPQKSGGGKAEALLQGPSIIGVKHGGEKDKQLAKFVEFLFDQDNKVEGGTKSLIEGFDSDSQYMTPFKNAFSGKNPWSLEKTGGNKITYDIFKDVAAKKVALFNNPISADSKSIREHIDTVLRENLYKGQSSEQASALKNADDIYKEVVRTLNLDQVS